MKNKRITFTFDLNRYEGGLCIVNGNSSTLPKFIQRDMSKLKSNDEISILSYEKNGKGEYVKTFKIFELVEVT
jgi:hypothetical protein